MWWFLKQWWRVSGGQKQLFPSILSQTGIIRYGEACASAEGLHKPCGSSWTWPQHPCWGCGLGAMSWPAPCSCALYLEEKPPFRAKASATHKQSETTLLTPSASRGGSADMQQHLNSLVLLPFQSQTAYLQCVLFLLRVLFQQYLQHLPPGLFIVPGSGEKAKDSIRNQEHVLHHASEPRQEPENVQQGCNTVRQVVQRGRGVVKNAVTQWSGEGQPGKAESVKPWTCFIKKINK